MKIFYCDGSTKGINQKGADNTGGWGVVWFNCDDEEELSLISFNFSTTTCTTNNREELKALLYCLEIIDEKYPKDNCIIYSDSAYVVNMFNDWIHTWAQNGWKNSKKQTVENLDLVQEIYKHIQNSFKGYDIRKCRGHIGEEGNELADALATANYNKFVKLCDLYNFTISNADYTWLTWEMDKNK